MMSRRLRFLVGLVFVFAPGLLRADPGPMSIWFTNAPLPGNTTTWFQESLPLGNGRLAAMIYGGVGSEQVQFNEDTIWTGQPHDYSHPNGASYLANLQSNIFNMASGQANFWTACSANFMSLPLRQPAYQPAGTLNLAFPHSGLASYQRSLNLSNATVNVKYDYSGVSYNRDYFASAPSNKVIVIRLTASQSAKITFTATFSTLQTSSNYTVGNDLVMHANVINNGDARYYNTGCTNAVRYDARLRVLAEGGAVSTTGSSISVTNADAVTLLLAVASNVINYNDVSADYVTICSNNIAAA
ncbi:MAG: glycoside hydrolase family 95 protein, partial [Verrucomicrobia bacterium]